MKASVSAFLSLGIAAYAIGVVTEKWTPSSKTAASVTGAVRLSSSGWHFQNGESLRLAAVAHTADKSRNVFRVVGKSNPALLNGNTLCGEQLPSYVFVMRNQDALAIAVFDSDSPPTLEFDVSMPIGACATYYYEK